jgi:hypothetical protein
MRRRGAHAPAAPRFDMRPTPESACGRDAPAPSPRGPPHPANLGRPGLSAFGSGGGCGRNRGAGSRYRCSGCRCRCGYGRRRARWPGCCSRNRRATHAVIAGAPHRSHGNWSVARLGRGARPKARTKNRAARCARRARSPRRAGSVNSGSAISGQQSSPQRSMGTEQRSRKPSPWRRPPKPRRARAAARA